MPMLLLALLQATPALPADNVQAAYICRQAVVTGGPPLPLEVTAQFTYYTQSAARAMPGDGDFNDRMRAAMAPDAGPGPMSAEAAQAALVACDQRFPLARRNGAVTLPADAFERDMMCAAVGSVLTGSARGYGERTGDTAPYVRIRALAARFQQRTIPAMLARGITDQAAQWRAVGGAIFASLDLGNAIAVTNACEAVPAS